MPENINTFPDPPLVDVKVTNPVTYIKRWWQKIIGNEGMELRFRVRPLTAIAISVVIASVAFGVGKFVLPFTIPFLKYNPTPIPTQTPAAWRETAYTGTLQYSIPTNRYYLVTSASEAITLKVPTNIDLKDLVGRRILVAGKYNKSARILEVADTKSMEVLPKNPVAVPTITPTPTEIPKPSASADISPSPTPISSPES